MASAKEIRTKVSSVKSTQKITSAMQMVAASKMKKTQEREAAAAPYAHMMRRVIHNIASSGTNFDHPYLKERDVKSVGYLIISTDRGLCGGLNINLFKHVLNEMKEYKEKNIDISMSLVGSKACAFFGNLGCNVLAHTSGMGDDPSVDQLIGTVRVMLEAFDSGKIDKLFIVYNEFVNTMVQRVKTRQLIPLPKRDENEKKANWDYIYEPDPKILFDTILKRYIECQVYQAVVENLASEQAARMMAMKSATDNAESLVSDLQLVYNKARQASITQELTEIVSGAAAV